MESGFCRLVSKYWRMAGVVPPTRLFAFLAFGLTGNSQSFDGGVLAAPRSI